jgi:hypothetical protein
LGGGKILGYDTSREIRRRISTEVGERASICLIKNEALQALCWSFVLRTSPDLCISPFDMFCLL